MDISALSMGLGQMKVAQGASLSVMKMVMDTAQGQAADLTQMLEANAKMMEQSVNPHQGVAIDIKI